jgi:hypothetical protein
MDSPGTLPLLLSLQGRANYGHQLRHGKVIGGIEQQNVRSIVTVVVAIFICLVVVGTDAGASLISLLSLVPRLDALSFAIANIFVPRRSRGNDKSRC